MLKNYFQVALRVLLRNPGYSAINIVGLSLGLSCCILIALFVREEWSYDTFHEQADSTYRLYRVEHRVRTPIKQSEAVMAPLATEMEAQIGGLKHVARLTIEEGVIDVTEEQWDASVAYADPSFLDAFSFGGTSSLLLDPTAIVITEELAELVLGSTQVVGEHLDLISGGERTSFRVAGVIPTLPTNSSIQFDVLAPLIAWPDYENAQETWDSYTTTTYVVLEDGVQPAAVQSAIAPIIASNYGGTIQEMIGRGWWEDREGTFRIEMQPIKNTHLSAEIDAFASDVSNPLYTYILLGIGLAVLLIACANFMTMALGRSVARAQEVGMRKALGATRTQLAAQFLGEATLIAGISAGIGLATAELFLPVFNRLAGKALDLGSASDIWFLVGLTMVTGLAAGSYPAFALSGLQPAVVLKGSGGGLGLARFSRSVIIAQFVVSIVMTTATFIMIRQMDFVATQDLGFNAEEIMVVPMSGSASSTEETQRLFAERIKTIPGIVSASASSSGFGSSWSRTVLSKDEVNHIVYTNYVTPAFLETMGIQLLQGRNLSAEFESDPEGAVLINEAFALAMGWENPIGEYLPRWTNTQVVGLVEDFNHLSLHEAVPPTLLHMSTALGGPDYTMIRFRADRAGSVLQGLEKSWAEVSPGVPFQVEFLDQRLQGLYESEGRWQEVITYAALFAILISCLGLFGVAAMATARRRKEIGVRRVLGASVTSLAVLVSRDFARLVLIAFVVAAPLSYFVMERWLESFAYRAPFSLAVFAAAGGAAFVVAMLTVSYQALAAARHNPTESLGAD